MKNTGERLLPIGFDQIAIEHLHRYAFALEYIKDKEVVDIASGEGYGSHLLASRANNVIGIDKSDEAIGHAKAKYKKNNLQYIQGSADKIPVDSNSIDVVVSFETIEHHDQHHEMMKEIKRILKSDGILIISSPDKMYYSDVPEYKNEYHIKELYFDEFKALIESFFTHTIFLNQKVTYSSLIIQQESNLFSEISGNFDEIKKHNGLEKPIYNIAVASQNKIESVFSSNFNGDSIYKELIALCEKKAKTIDEILNSKTYKLGNFLISPFRNIPKFFKKRT